MKKILYCLFLFIVCSIESCKEDKEQLPLFDFGSETFDEPFVGLLSSRPNILVKSLEYPPFSWLMSDTVSFSKDLEIEFNEDCVRSNSLVTMYITDTIFNPIKGISVYYNNFLVRNGITIKADSILKRGNIRIAINPEMKDTILTGFVLAEGNAIDTANDVDLQNTNNVIAKWTGKQKIGWPILIWGSWLAILVAIIAILGCMIIWVVRTILITKVILSINKLVDLRKITFDSKKAKKRGRKENNKRTKKEKTLREILLKKYPDIVDVIDSLVEDVDCTSWDEFQGDFRFRIIKLWSTVPSHSNWKITLKGSSVVIAEGGCRNAHHYINIADIGYNEFLSYRMPNKKYVIDDYMTYKTDKYGRVKIAYAKISDDIIVWRGSRLSAHQNRIVQSQDGFLGSDEGGHIIQMALGGCNELINQIPQNAFVNKGHYNPNLSKEKNEKNMFFKDLERWELKMCCSEDNEIEIFRKFRYKNRSMRPFQIVANCKINGKSAIIKGVKGPFIIDNP